MQHQVSTELSDTGEVVWDSYRHFYTEARADLQGRGWLGFAETQGGPHPHRRHHGDRVRQRDPGLGHQGVSVRPPAEEDHVHGQGLQQRERAGVRATTTNGRSIRRYPGTYGVELRTVGVTERERAVGATGWQTLRTNTTENGYDDFGNLDVTTSTTRAGERSRWTPTTATTPRPG